LLPFEALGPSQPPSRVPSPARFYQQIDEVFTSVEPPLIPDPEIDRFQVDRPSLAIPAMKEEPYIRLAYLQAVMGNVFGKLTWEMATQTLNNTLDCLAIAGRLPVHPRPVRTLQSARQRLGIDPDLWIIQYAICPVCWKHFTPKEMANLEAPGCLSLNCAGEIYKINNKGKRVANLICPQVSIIECLRRMFLRPGFAKLVERKPEHQPGRNSDVDFIMKDISDGEMWYKDDTRTIRQVGSQGTIRDVSIDGNPITKLYSRRFGLQITLNLDWCRIFYHTHSVLTNKCYLLLGLFRFLDGHTQQDLFTSLSTTFLEIFATSKSMHTAWRSPLAPMNRLKHS
jgi:hypothetical protein